MKSHRLIALLIAAAAVASAQAPRLANLSTRAQAGTGSNVLTAGFVIGAGGSKQVLIRAVGPTIGAAPFNVPGTLSDPVLTLFNSSNVVVATNDNWGTPVGTSPIDAATFSSVGAFALPSGSRDAAILTTLAPGAYTAQASGAGGTTGIAIVEVYEMSSTSAAKLINLSSRAQVGTNANVMIPGLVVSAGGGTRRLLVRAAGPALAAFNLTGTLADPTITLVNNTSGAAIATNDNWGTPVGSGAVDGNTLAAAFGQAGAFSFAAGSRDAALLVDLSPGNYGIQVSGVGGTTGLAIVEVYDLTPANAAIVTVSASKASADESGANNGEYTFSRTGDTLLPLTVNYSVGGSATNGYDYPLLTGTITIPSGASSAKLALAPNPTVEPGDKTATVSLASGSSYIVGTQSSATVNIAYTPATLYLASVRPTSGAVAGSIASGTATILLSASGTLAAVNVTFTGLSSAEVTAHLVLGGQEDYVLALPNGQVSGVQWYFTPNGNYTATDLLNALKSGNLAVRIDSAKYPTGEVKGTFIQAAGSRVFTPPAAPPAISLTGVTATDAARLLTQATFGPTKTEIDALTGGSIDAWITAQLAMPFSSHRQALLDDKATFGGSGSFTNWNAIYPPNRQAAWFKLALTAPDQLRQRVAFALSQLLVVSDVALGGDNQAEPLANYYDILGNGALGNFRTLLENVTLSPMMGLYLSSLRNAKADATTGQTPDENYAREVMQLFTIGLNQLQPDGTLLLGNDGLPLPTYNQATVTEMAKVFTGWSYFTASPTTATFRTGRIDYINPMVQFAAFHDLTQKNIVNGVVLPANQDGVTDLRLTLDALVNHPNTAPFVARQLIQRLVTSNPSPAYVYRVAQVFTQQRSSPTQLAAVVRAILTDYEARSPAVVSTETYGKLKEPLLRLVGALRSFGATSASGRFLGFRVAVDGTPINGGTPIPAAQTQITTLSSPTRLDAVQNNLAEAALRSATVFNFYHPDYVLPGALAQAGLVAPEFEITDDNYAINVPNFLRTFALASAPSTAAGPYTLTLNLTYEQSLLGNLPALLDHLSLVLCDNAMPAATRTKITSALNALPSTTTPLERAQTAVLLTLTSPASAVQK